MNDNKSRLKIHDSFLQRRSRRERRGEKVEVSYKVVAERRLYFPDRGRKGPLIRSRDRISFHKQSQAERKPSVRVL